MDVTRHKDVRTVTGGVRRATLFKRRADLNRVPDFASSSGRSGSRASAKWNMRTG